MVRGSYCHPDRLGRRFFVHPGRACMCNILLLPSTVVHDRAIGRGKSAGPVYDVEGPPCRDRSRPVPTGGTHYFLDYSIESITVCAGEELTLLIDGLALCLMGCVVIK